MQNTGLATYTYMATKDKSIPFNIDWFIITRAAPYHPSIKSCQLCIMEKTKILQSDHKFPLNKRSEMMGKCRHRIPFI